MLRRFFIVVASLCATLLAGECLMRLLPVSTATMTGYYGDPDLLIYPPGHQWQASTGWDLRNAQILRSNNLGFVSDKDYVADASALVLIGDSYVEAGMLRQQDRPAAQLASLLHPSRVVYGFGSPGTALLDYAQRVRYASQKLQVTDFVVWLEAGDARQSLCGSGNVHSRCLDPQTLAPRIERLPPPSTFKRWARHSALAQYVFGQLKVNPAQLASGLLPHSSRALAPDAAAQAAETRPGSAARQRSDAIVAAAVDGFFAEAGPYLRGRLLFVVDGRRVNQNAASTLLDLERQNVMARLRIHGAEVVDMEPVYRTHAAQSSLSLEVGPYDHHLNAIGVQLVMSAVAQRLEQ